MNNYVAYLIVDRAFEGFTALQMAYIAELRKCNFQDYTETDINNELSKYNPFKKTWAPVAMSLSRRGFIERGGFTYDIDSSKKKIFNPSIEKGCVLHEEKLKRLLKERYNIINIERFRQVFDIIISKNNYSEIDYEEMIHNLNKYIRTLENIDSRLRYFKVGKKDIDELVRGLGRDKIRIV